MNLEVKVNHESRYYLFDEVNDTITHQEFLEHALEVYLIMSEQIGGVPRFIFLFDMFNPYHDTPLSGEHVSYFKGYLMNIYKDELIGCGSVKDFIDGKMEEHYYELDIYYKDDLLKAWSDDLRLFFLDESKVNVLANEPFRGVW